MVVRTATFLNEAYDGAPGRRCRLVTLGVAKILVVYAAGSKSLATNSRRWTALSSTSFDDAEVAGFAMMCSLVNRASNFFVLRLACL